VDLMSKRAGARRRPAAQITLARAARLRRMVVFLAGGPRTRDAVLEAVGLGLRTFYREQGLLRRCGVRIRQREGRYWLGQSVADAEGSLPVPDPQLSLAELTELAKGEGPAARRMATLLEAVTGPTGPPVKPAKRAGKRKGTMRGG
jgi:hypothetical protein